MFLPGKIIESFNILNFLLKKNPMFVNVKNSDKPLLFFWQQKQIAADILHLFVSEVVTKRMSMG